MYLAYLKERERVEVIESLEGFLSYRINNDEFFISDVYIRPEFRRKGCASALADSAYMLAKKSECKFMTCQADLAAVGCEASVSTILANGFKFFSAKDDKMSFYLEVENG